MTWHVSSTCPGIGGRLRLRPEDFQVWELPAYEASGAGPHLLVQVTKRDLTTPELVRRLAGALGVPAEEVGYAGMKDRQAVTCQCLSLPAECEQRLGSVAGVEGLLDLRVLGRHPNKLRRGHLKGNRFQIRVREVTDGAGERIEAVADCLTRHGWPNFYGSQRFGRARENFRIGLEGLQRGYLSGPAWKRSLMVSALQAGLFNRYLEARMVDGLFERILPGDVCARLPLGGIFVCRDPAAEQPRLERLEISPTGPLFGFKMMPAEGPALEREQALLAEVGLDPAAFRSQKAPGSRRRLRLALGDFSWELEGPDAVFSFELPAGSYATVLLDEFLKANGELEEEPQE